jgi:hypothetical protein
MNNASTNLEDFAAAANASARKAEGSHGLVLINRAHAQYVADFGTTDLASFKRWLWAAAKAGLVKLASHDMPQLLSATDRDDSAIERGASTFNLIRI